MTKQRVMLLGAAGQIGQTFRYAFETLPSPATWEMGWFTRQEVDMTDPSALRDAVQTFQPELIINAAALSRVEEAEKNELAATRINFHAVANIAAQASAQDIPVIHLSTDFVFDGRQETPYKPEDLMNPINQYGASKMMGEEALRHGMPWHVILRVSAVFGAFSNNILTSTIKMIEEQDELRFVTDRISGPTPAIDLVHALMTIGEKILGGKVDGFGTFHYCGAPACSRHELTEAIMQAYAPFTTRRPSILPVLSTAFPDHAPRPAYSVLECNKIKAIYGIQQPSWKEGLKQAIQTINKSGNKIS
ncbi:MAG TPA: dTDP-4-dehydrorhamnose reductase [Rhodospirillaceae bacterium]|nr:dTDP-4-dehydrorhamnose reductase [Rhodospirillaceae bacterium]